MEVGDAKAAYLALVESPSTKTCSFLKALHTLAELHAHSSLYHLVLQLAACPLQSKPPSVALLYEGEHKSSTLKGDGVDLADANLQGFHVKLEKPELQSLFLVHAEQEHELGIGR